MRVYPNFFFHITCVIDVTQFTYPCAIMIQYFLTIFLNKLLSFRSIKSKKNKRLYFTYMYFFPTFHILFM